MVFSAVLELHGKTATGIEVPASVVEALGSGKKPKVVVTINGYSYSSSVAVYGGVYMLPVAAENRVGAGIEAGQTIEIDLTLDTQPREVTVPDDLAAAMDAAPGARAKFESLSYSNKKEHVVQVESAKTQETRERRIAKVLQSLA